MNNRYSSSDAKHNAKKNTLWRWICKRLGSLTIGCITVIAFCMWLRYFINNIWIAYEMPQSERIELTELRQNPNKDIHRYHEIIDKWYGIQYSDPNIDSSDWMLLFILVIITAPVMFFIILRAVRPVSMHISQLASVTRSVAKGSFGVCAEMHAQLPDELYGLTIDINAMSSQLARYEKELKASNVAMAHELRSPLTASIGRLQGMLDGVFEPSHAQLSMVMRQLQDLNRLVDDLHFLSLADAGQLHLNMLKCNIVEVIKEKVAWAKPRLLEYEITATITTESKVSCIVDSFRLGQVISILLDNAIRYASEGKKIDINIQTRDNWALISFRDYGPGVTDAFLAILFERFSRADISRSRHSGGSGLGLSIATVICEAQGGSLKADKAPSGGLIFTIKLPLAT